MDLLEETRRLLEENGRRLEKNGNELKLIRYRICKLELNKFFENINYYDELTLITKTLKNFSNLDKNIISETTKYKLIKYKNIIKQHLEYLDKFIE